MREIKFRQFIGEKMQYWGFLEGAFFGPSSNGADSQNAQNTPQMQFTGLKDRNGKEIYEGDIVRQKTGRGSWKNREVRFDGGRFYYVGQHETAHIYSNDTTEVIGDIYRNNELLV